MDFFAWLEHSGLAMWIKESDTLLGGYDLYLASHAVGMAILVGLSAAVALRILGFAPRLPLAPMEGFFPLMFAGFWINAVSGAVLFITYPVKAVTNPGFYIKMGGVVLAVVCLRRLRLQVFGNPVCLDTRPVPMNGKILAGTLLFTWVATITAGRLMAYHGVAGVEWGTSLAMLVVTGVMLLAGYAAVPLLGWSKPSQMDV
jgi:hypothetical protein